MRKGRRQRLKQADEWDVIYRAPINFDRGEKKAVKRRLNKRARQEAKKEYDQKRMWEAASRLP